MARWNQLPDARSRRLGLTLLFGAPLAIIGCTTAVPPTTTTTTAKPTTTTAKPTTTTAKPTTTTAKPTTTTAKPTTTTTTSTTSTTMSTTTTTDPTRSNFDITFRFLGTPTAEQQSLVRQAGARWELAITGDLPEVNASIPAGQCLAASPAVSRTVDDILIDIEVVAIDGPGGIIGQAGPCWTSDYMPFFGALQVDSDDAAGLVSSGLFDEVVVHELAHILGLGTLWSYGRTLIDESNSSQYRFVGPAASTEWSALGGLGSGVPIEMTGGAGTQYSHWSEATFDTELMTGWIDNTNQISRLTIGSLADLGYTVNLDAADAYSLPSAAMRTGTAALERAFGIVPPEELAHDLPIRELG